MRSVRAEASRNERGSAEDRRRRRAWLVETYAADTAALVIEYPSGLTLTYDVALHSRADAEACGYPTRTEPACRCYRCGVLLTVDTVTVDRIIPGCRGGTYRRNNIRPACLDCNREAGACLRGAP